VNDNTAETRRMRLQESIDEFKPPSQYWGKVLAERNRLKVENDRLQAAHTALGELLEGGIAYRQVKGEPQNDYERAADHDFWDTVAKARAAYRAAGGET